MNMHGSGACAPGINDPLEQRCRDRRVVLVLGGATDLPTHLPGDVTWAVGSGFQSVTDRLVDVFHVRETQAMGLPVNGAPRSRWPPQVLLMHRDLSVPWKDCGLQIWARDQEHHQLLVVLTQPRQEYFNYCRPRTLPRNVGLIPGAGVLALHLLEGLASKVVICGDGHSYDRSRYWYRKRMQAVDAEFIRSWRERQPATAIDTRFFHR